MTDAAFDILSETEHILPFRGTRPYVHSTSVINAIFPILDGATTLTVRFSRMTAHNRLRFVHLPSDIETPREAVFDAWWSRPDGRGKLVIFETGDAEPQLRVPYAEEEAVRGWNLIGGRAELAAGAGLGYTLIDRLVALNKAYLTATFPVERTERYIATRCDLKGRVPALAALSLVHMRRIGASHHATRITADGVDAGLIYFARQQL